MNTLRAIETIYDKHNFRSRAEAKWAVVFNSLNIPYVYEPEGFYLSDGTMYLPDFYLPECGQWFEVKGVMHPKDIHKIEMFIKESGCALTVGYEDFTFQACDNWWYNEFSLADKHASILASCRTCGKKWFMGTNGSYACPCCDAYDGDRGFDTLAFGDGDNAYTAIEAETAFNAGRYARFEHGESPRIA